MQVKVCKNCLQSLSAERRANGYTTCIGCSTKIKAAQQTHPSSPLLATLKKDFQAQLEEEAKLKENERRQQNIKHFFDDFKKIKRT
jgi:hypothetical protein